MGSIVTLPVALLGAVLAFKPGDIVFWTKWTISYICAKWAKSQKRLDFYDPYADGDAEKLNYVIPRSEYALELPQSDEHTIQAQDEITIYGVNSKNELLFVNISRRCNGKAFAHLILRLADGRRFHLSDMSDFQQEDRNVFSCGPLRLEVLDPMRRWRITYNGYLKTSVEGTQEESVYVRFSLFWKSTSDIFDFREDISPRTIANILAGLSWPGLSPPMASFRKAVDCYGQSGVIHGMVHVNEEAEHELYLFGHRTRNLGSAQDLKDAVLHQYLGYVRDDGSLVHLAWFDNSSKKEYLFGFVILADSFLEEIVKTDGLKKIEHEKVLNFKAGVQHKFCLIERSSEFQETYPDSGISVGNIKFQLNELDGQGLHIKRFPVRRLERIILPTQKPKSVRVPETVSFKEHACQNSATTGGKGSSLAILKVFSEKSNQFIVPDGVVVTTSSYATFLTKEIREKISQLENVLYGKTDGDVKEACDKTIKQIVDTNFPNTLRLKIEQKLNDTFGSSLHSSKFAVRSSATGEDTEQMSAAGQMDTYLGVAGLTEICEAVKKCWASQFSYVAVQYKRRYGQPLNMPMAVVIQKMASCDVAGVLFTSDPLTGNRTRMTITANYGLGESVVSGSEEPDTIHLERDCQNNLKIKSTAVGAKSHKIVVKDGEGTITEAIPENERSVCCLTEEMCMRLGHLAIEIEKLYRSSRDIEWGICGKDIYIFQSRPITISAQYSTYDIEHEFDGTMRVENDYFSGANIAEVMPGALSTLGFQVFWRSFWAGMARKQSTEWMPTFVPRYFNAGMLLCRGHLMFNVADIFRLGGDGADMVTKALVVSFFGREIRDDGMFAVARNRHKYNRDKLTWKKIINLMIVMLSTGRVCRRTIKAFRNYSMSYEKYKDAKGLFYYVISHAADLTDVAVNHMVCSQTSSIWNNMVFTTLGQAHGAFDDVVYRDLANLLKTNSAVESADVPSAMQNLAYHISQEIKPDEFKKMTPEEARNWLKSAAISGKKFEEFMKNHGHRCIQEFDVHRQPWRTNELSLVKLLQSLSGNVSKTSHDKKSDNYAEVISQLQVPLGYLDKLKLRILLPLSRGGVQNRELSKSLFVRCVDQWRKAYCRVAELMVLEGRLPEQETLFFMTLDEIREHLDNPSPQILARASQRQRLHPQMNKYLFPEIVKGMPQPMNAEENPIIPSEENFMMKGIPVSQGVVKAFVRLAITLEEAASLQPGEILLTHSTDIGWSPYFPALAGVVTELGGLISHGAVVSREYGIPCIAGLHGATRRFQTGDYVLLNGNKGTLQKLKPPESD